MRKQHGGALLVMLMIASVTVAYLFATALTGTRDKLERDEITARALAQAKEALIGWSASHTSSRYGVLPLPDLGTSRNNSTPGEGSTAGNFPGNTKNLTVIGRLPWRELGIPPLRDSRGECLWYAVSGTFQNPVFSDVLNWDSLGHLDLHTSNGTTAGTISESNNSYNSRPIAIVFSPGDILPGQNRSASGTDTVTECGGNYNVRNYLDSYTANASINNIRNYFPGSPNNATGYAYGLVGLTDIYSTPIPDAAIVNPGSTVKKLLYGKTSVATQLIANDAALSITTNDLFAVVGRHKTFGEDINQMLYKLSSCLSPPSPTPFVATAPTNKGVDYSNSLFNSCNVPNIWFRNNWRENLLYIKPASGKVAVNGDSDCDAVLIFSGSRTATQRRATAAERQSASNYLEDIPADLPFTPARPNLSQYAQPNPVFIGRSPTPSQYNTNDPSADVFRCLKPGMPVSFASTIGAFVASGTGVTTDITDPSNPTVTIANGGAGGSCFWYPNLLPLLKKTIRAYYTYQFGYADPVGGVDRGNGFTFSLLRGDLPLQTLPLPPIPCGTQADMGSLNNLSGWGGQSYIIETDVHQDATTSDTAGNHTAIMAYGNLVHSSTNGNLTTACDGSAAGCSHSPVSKFEESPAPLLHNQRIEIHSGCTPGCTSCYPPGHGGANTSVRISAWIDCTSCNDVAANVDRIAQPPTINRCIASMNAAMDNVYVGFTGGFRSGAAQQSVTIGKFDLRSE